MSLSSEFYNIKRLREYLSLLEFKKLPIAKTYAQTKLGISLADILQDKNTFSKALIKDLKNKNYFFGKAKVRVIKTKNKERIVYSFDLIDSVVAGYISFLMSQEMENHFCENLFSYRKGKDFWQPISMFSQYTREHLKKYSSPKERGLYVLRRDFSSYTDNIPVSSESQLWVLLEKYFQLSSDQYLKKIIYSIIRVEVESQKGNYTMFRGIPTGQPITTILANIYPIELDIKFEQWKANSPGLFYIRYSDDIIVAHESLSTIKTANNILNKMAAELSLEFQPGKAENYFFNGAARDCELDKSFSGKDQIEFLGCNIKFNGTISLKSKHIKWLLKRIKYRVESAAKVFQSSDEDQFGREICHGLNYFLWSDKSFSQIKNMTLLRKAVTDRGQLKDFDYQIAKYIASKISQQEGVRAFKEIPYKKIRSQWKLKSFLHSRNLSGS